MSEVPLQARARFLITLGRCQFCITLGRRLIPHHIIRRPIPHPVIDRQIPNQVITEPDCKDAEHRGTSLIRNSTPLRPYSRTMPRALWWSLGGGGCFLSARYPCTHHVRPEADSQSHSTRGQFRIAVDWRLFSHHVIHRPIPCQVIERLIPHQCRPAPDSTSR